MPNRGTEGSGRKEGGDGRKDKKRRTNELTPQEQLEEIENELAARREMQARIDAAKGQAPDALDDSNVVEQPEGHQAAAIENQIDEIQNATEQAADEVAEGDVNQVALNEALDEPGKAEAAAVIADEQAPGEPDTAEPEVETSNEENEVVVDTKWAPAFRVETSSDEQIVLVSPGPSELLDVHLVIDLKEEKADVTFSGEAASKLKDEDKGRIRDRLLGSVGEGIARDNKTIDAWNPNGILALIDKDPAGTITAEGPLKTEITIPYSEATGYDISQLSVRRTSNINVTQPQLERIAAVVTALVASAPTRAGAAEPGKTKSPDAKSGEPLVLDIEHWEAKLEHPTRSGLVGIRFDLGTVPGADIQVIATYSLSNERHFFILRGADKPRLTDEQREQIAAKVKKLMEAYILQGYEQIANWPIKYPRARRTAGGHSYLDFDGPRCNVEVEIDEKNRAVLEVIPKGATLSDPEKELVRQKFKEWVGSHIDDYLGPPVPDAGKDKHLSLDLKAWDSSLQGWRIEGAGIGSWELAPVPGGDIHVVVRYDLGSEACRTEITGADESRLTVDQRDTIWAEAAKRVNEFNEASRAAIDAWSIGPTTRVNIASDGQELIFDGPLGSQVRVGVKDIGLPSMSVVDVVVRNDDAKDIISDPNRDRIRQKYGEAVSAHLADYFPASPTPQPPRGGSGGGSGDPKLNPLNLSPEELAKAHEAFEGWTSHQTEAVQALHTAIAEREGTDADKAAGREFAGIKVGGKFEEIMGKLEQHKLLHFLTVGLVGRVYGAHAIPDLVRYFSDRKAITGKDLLFRKAEPSMADDLKAMMEEFEQVKIEEQQHMAAGTERGPDAANASLERLLELRKKILDRYGHVKTSDEGYFTFEGEATLRQVNVRRELDDAISSMLWDHAIDLQDRMKEGATQEQRKEFIEGQFASNARTIVGRYAEYRVNGVQAARSALEAGLTLSGNFLLRVASSPLTSFAANTVKEVDRGVRGEKKAERPIVGIRVESFTDDELREFGLDPVQARKQDRAEVLMTEEELLRQIDIGEKRGWSTDYLRELLNSLQSNKPYAPGVYDPRRIRAATVRENLAALPNDIATIAGVIGRSAGAHLKGQFGITERRVETGPDGKDRLHKATMKERALVAAAAWGKNLQMATVGLLAVNPKDVTDVAEWFAEHAEKWKGSSAGEASAVVEKCLKALEGNATRTTPDTAWYRIDQNLLEATNRTFGRWFNLGKSGANHLLGREGGVAAAPEPGGGAEKEASSTHSELGGDVNEPSVLESQKAGDVAVAPRGGKVDLGGDVNAASVLSFTRPAHRVDSGVAQLMADLKADSEASGVTPASAERGVPDTAVPQPGAKSETLTADLLGTAEVRKGGSLLQAAQEVYRQHATELGYKGDLHDTKALRVWAERQAPRRLVFDALSRSQDPKDLELFKKISQGVDTTNPVAVDQAVRHIPKTTFNRLLEAENKLAVHVGDQVAVAKPGEILRPGQKAGAVKVETVASHTAPEALQPPVDLPIVPTSPEKLTQLLDQLQGTNGVQVPQHSIADLVSLQRSGASEAQMREAISELFNSDHDGGILTADDAPDIVGAGTVLEPSSEGDVEGSATAAHEEAGETESAASAAAGDLEGVPSAIAVETVGGPVVDSMGKPISADHFFGVTKGDHSEVAWYDGATTHSLDLPPTVHVNVIGEISYGAHGDAMRVDISSGNTLRSGEVAMVDGRPMFFEDAAPHAPVPDGIDFKKATELVAEHKGSDINVAGAVEAAMEKVAQLTHDQMPNLPQGYAAEVLPGVEPGKPAFIEINDVRNSSKVEPIHYPNDKKLSEANFIEWVNQDLKNRKLGVASDTPVGQREEVRSPEPEGHDYTSDNIAYTATLIANKTNGGSLAVLTEKDFAVGWLPKDSHVEVDTQKLTVQLLDKEGNLIKDATAPDIGHLAKTANDLMASNR